MERFGGGGRFYEMEMEMISMVSFGDYGEINRDGGGRR